MLKAKVVKASTAQKLEEKINSVLSHVSDKFVDLKLSGANDGKDEVFIAVILYK